MSWRAKILEHFNAEVDRVAIAADPDRLLLDEVVAEELYTRGFEVISYDDPIVFRLVYESKYRALWDRGKIPERSVIIRTDLDDVNSLPFDILKAGRYSSISLSELFPGLSYTAVASLDRGLLDTLYKAQEQRITTTLGDNETKDFILRHVFGVVPDLINNPSDLLLLLLRLHFRRVDLPDELQRRLIDVLAKVRFLQDWPLEIIVADRLDFFAFLQERWPVFLDHIAGNLTEEMHPSGVSKLPLYNFRFRGPTSLPFGDPDVRAFIDTLFYEGLLQPIEYPHTSELLTSWAIVGVKIDPEADRKRRFEGLIGEIGNSVPDDSARYQEWIDFAGRWAELLALKFEIDSVTPGLYESQFSNIQGQVDSRFLNWVLKRYGGLHNQAPTAPAMVHHLPRFLSRELERSRAKRIAMVVLDGMALDQWVVLRNVLLRQEPSLRFREDGMLAWVPTLTSVSRQALFAGRPPIYFPETINTTEGEPRLWSQFWGEQGLSPKEVTYIKSLRDETSIKLVEDVLESPQVRVIGLVVDKLDRIMHGMELGKEGMHDQVRLWATKGFMTQLLNLLLGMGFEVYVTADHGNIHATGIGRLDEGALAEYRGERVRIFNDKGLRERVKAKFPDSLCWQSAALPEGYLPLLAPKRSAFITAGESRVVHGGISIEELIVPLIYVSREA